MRNQYLGDVGDYGKYGLLRFLAGNGIKIGVNWYLTEDDGSNDGKFVTYLNKSEERRYDPELYDALKIIVNSTNKEVDLVESRGLIKNAVYYNVLLKSKDIDSNARTSARDEWHKNALKQLHDADLIFADPDNGIIGSKTVRDREAEKFITPEEIKAYYDSGQNVVYYCQKARRTEVQWERTKSEMLKYIPESKIIVLTFHRGTQRSYIFVIHPEQNGKYVDLMRVFLQGPWGELFTEESAQNVVGKEKAPISSIKKETKMRTERSEKKLKTTEPGYVNRNGQENMGKTMEMGTDHGQWFYKMKCQKCCHIYKANGSDIFQRKCPRCQGGRP